MTFQLYLIKCIDPNSLSKIQYPVVAMCLIKIDQSLFAKVSLSVLTQ